MPPPGATWRGEKGPFKEHLSQDFSKGLSSRVYHFAFLTTFFFKGNPVFNLYVVFLIFNFVAFWQQNLPLLWGLYNPKVGIIMKFRLVQVSLNCVV